MKIIRQILSLLLLGAYALLLMHDAIPHSHNTNGELSQGHFPIAHQHGEGLHSHHHHDQSSNQETDGPLSFFDVQVHAIGKVHRHHFGYKHNQSMKENDLLALQAVRTSVLPSSHSPITFIHPSALSSKLKPRAAISPALSLRGPPSLS